MPIPSYIKAQLYDVRLAGRAFQLQISILGICLNQQAWYPSKHKTFVTFVRWSSIVQMFYKCLCLYCCMAWGRIIMIK